MKIMNILKLTAKLSPISCCGISSKSSVFTAKQGNTTPFIFLFLGFHTSTNPRICKYGFEDIKNLDQAVTLFQKMLQMKPTPTVNDYNKLLIILVRMKCYSQVIVMFKNMSLLGCPVNDYTMNTVINCYCNMREVEMGFAILPGFFKRGYAPDTVSITCLIKGLFLVQNVVKAVDLFKNLIKGKLGCEVDEFTISVVLHGLCKSGNLVQAVELLEILEKRECKLNVVVYSAVLDGLCKARMMEDAMNLFLKMIDKGIDPNVVTYTSFIHGLCKNKKFNFACSIFDDLSSKRISPDLEAYTVMIKGLCKEGRFRDAKEMLKRMDTIGCIPNNVTYNTIIQVCLQHRYNIDSIDLFQEIIGRDFQPSARTFFQFLRQMQVDYGDRSIRKLIERLISSQMKEGGCDQPTTMALLQNLIFTYRDKNLGSDVMIRSLLQKLISTKMQLCFLPL